MQIDKTEGESALHNRFTLVLIIFYGSLTRVDIKKNGFNLSLRLIGLLLSLSSSPFEIIGKKVCVRNSKLSHSDLLVFG